MVNKINISNVIKFPSPFERLKSYTNSPDVILRKAIITQAIIDATNISELRVAKKLELEAKSWIFGGSESFKATCMEGEIEPAFVVKVTKEIIELHKSKSNFRKQSQQNSVNSKKSLFKTKL